MRPAGFFVLLPAHTSSLSLQGLLPSYIDYQSGNGVGGELTMGAMADSYYEYLLKASAAVTLPVFDSGLRCLCRR